MKTKLILSTTFIALALFSQSCKKDYECHCEKKSGGADHIVIKAKKADAEADCKSRGETNANYSSCVIE